MEIDLFASGQRIKMIRKRHSYTMLAFAKLLGISSASTVNNWEKGNNLPKPDRLEKIAIFGNTTINWIKYGELEDYVFKLLQTIDVEKQLDDYQFSALIQQLEVENITFRNDLSILNCARALYPKIFTATYQINDLKNRNLVIAEDTLGYTIEHNNRYRTLFLPLVEELLIHSSRKKQNAMILLQMLKLLQQNTSKKQVTALSELLIFLTEQKSKYHENKEKTLTTISKQETKDANEKILALLNLFLVN